MFRLLKLTLAIPVLLLGLGLFGAAVSILFFKRSDSAGTIDAVAMGIIGLLTLAVARRLFRRSLLDINISIAKQMYADTNDVVSRFKHINVSRRWVVTVPAACLADIRPAINELRLLKKAISLQRRKVLNWKRSIRAQCGGRAANNRQLTLALQPFDDEILNLDECIVRTDQLILQIESRAL